MPAGACVAMGPAGEFRFTMPMYVYSTEGRPVGFLHANFIHDLEGTPLGRIVGSRVHRFDGSYVGEWFKETVVHRPEVRPRTIAVMAQPPAQPSPGLTSNRRGVIDYGLADVFHDLYQNGVGPAGSQSLDIAAE